MPDDQEKRREWRKIGIALNAGWLVAASILVSSLIGLGLDRVLRTGRLFLVIMFLFGIVAGMYNLIRELRKMD